MMDGQRYSEAEEEFIRKKSEELSEKILAQIKETQLHKVSVDVGISSCQLIEGRPHFELSYKVANRVAKMLQEKGYGAKEEISERGQFEPYSDYPTAAVTTAVTLTISW